MNEIDLIGKELSDIDCYVMYHFGKHIPDAISIRIIDTGIDVTRGEDEFYYSRKPKKSRRHLWYVGRSECLYIEKGFKCYKKAITEALKKRKKELSESLYKVNLELNKMENFYEN